MPGQESAVHLSRTAHIPLEMEQGEVGRSRMTRQTCRQVRVSNGAGVGLQSWVLLHSKMAMGEYGPSFLCMRMLECQFVSMNASHSKVRMSSGTTQSIQQNNEQVYRTTDLFFSSPSKGPRLAGRSERSYIHRVPRDLWPPDSDGHCEKYGRHSSTGYSKSTINIHTYIKSLH